MGERRTARIIWKYLANNHPEVIKKNLRFIPVFGRFDDLYEFVGTPVEPYMWEYMSDAFKFDLSCMKNNRPISLLAKWMKSVNTESVESRKLGILTAKKMGMSISEYRKTLSKMRKYIDVVERKMSNGDWGSINYEKVPSRAMNIYNPAFSSHDKERFDKYIKGVSKGELKINSGTLYPYDIVEKYMYRTNNVNEVLEEQWKALPNYVDGENNILVMADTSGSMYGRPMATSVGLAIYFAERNAGDFHGMFMTFSKHPELIEIKGETLRDKVKLVMGSDWGMNTNLESAFNLVLKTAVNNNVPKEEMPKSIVVISD